MSSLIWSKSSGRPGAAMEVRELAAERRLPWFEITPTACGCRRDAWRSFARAAAAARSSLDAGIWVVGCGLSRCLLSLRCPGGAAGGRNRLEDRSARSLSCCLFPRFFC